MNMEDAKQKLTELRKRIDSSNPVMKKFPEHIQWLIPSQDSAIIRYFENISKKIKDNFRTHQKIADVLKFEVEDPPTGKGAETGKIWHTSLKKCIDNPSTSANEIGKAVVEAVKKWLGDGDDGLQLLQSEFPLYGYMEIQDEEDDDGGSEISFWNGNVDAIGWYQDNYVIVEWKAVDLLEFWEKNRQAYGDYLHQCLVYAKLLMLHLNLPKLPYILIVPINSVTGANIRPGLFSDFPEECKDEIEKYEWLMKTKTMILNLPSGMFNNVDEIRGHDGFVQKDKKLRDVLKDEYTVKQFLLDKLGFEDCTVKQLLDILHSRSLDCTIEQLLYDSEYDEMKIV